jgi:hypothetical protein
MKKSIVSVALSLAFLVNVTPGFSLDTDDGSGPVNGVIPRGAVYLPLIIYLLHLSLNFSQTLTMTNDLQRKKLQRPQKLK